METYLNVACPSNQYNSIHQNSRYRTDTKPYQNVGRSPQNKRMPYRHNYCPSPQHHREQQQPRHHLQEHIYYTGDGLNDTPQLPWVPYGGNDNSNNKLGANSIVYMLGAGCRRYITVDNSNHISVNGGSPNVAKTHVHTSSNAGHLDNPIVRWAWSADRLCSASNQAVDSSLIRYDERCLPCSSHQQTDIHCNDNADLKHISTASSGDGCVQYKTVGTQYGVSVSNSTQVHETDIMVPCAHVDDCSEIGLQFPSSAHIPYSQVPQQDFPNVIDDAQVQGVCNKYGFLSMPRPPREQSYISARAADPVKYPNVQCHSHDDRRPSIDRQLSKQLSRTYDLWTQNTAFIQKF